MPSMPVVYEWVVEEVDAHGDILETSAWDTARDALRQMDTAPDAGHHYELCLTRNVGDNDRGLQDRDWAYLVGDQLPEQFDGGAKVPHRLRAELDAALSGE